MSTYKKLLNNSIIFAIGNLGTKFIVFFLVPIYTYYLSTAEYGQVDLLTTTLSLMLPLINLSIFDAVFRFVMDLKYDKHQILLNALIITVIGFLLLVTIYPILSFLLPIENNIIIFYLIILFQSINASLSQYIRAIGEVKLFALNGMLNALLMLILNIVFLVNFGLGLAGYLYAFLIANIICCLFLYIFSEVKKVLVWRNRYKLNVKLIREMLVYSTPLIPNTLMWWIMALSDRFVITIFLGLGANGIYAVANKIPNLLNIANTIFFQAWQMTAVEEADSKKKDIIFSKVFEVFSVMMLLVASLLILNVKIIINLLASADFFLAWKYVPFLILGTVFSSFAGFLGTNYIATKKTRGVFKTSLIGGVINVVLNFSLIPFIGINGASISTMVSFFLIWIIRIKDTKKFVSIKINMKNMVMTLSLIFIQILILYLEVKLSYIYQLIVFAAILAVNYKTIQLALGVTGRIVFKKYRVLSKSS